jgi:hypothetical protein
MSSSPEHEAECLRLKKSVSKIVRQAIKTQEITISDLARRMKTSRMVVHRLLDPTDTSCTLATIARASIALKLGLRLTI